MGQGGRRKLGSANELAGERLLIRTNEVAAGQGGPGEIVSTDECDAASQGGRAELCSVEERDGLGQGGHEEPELGGRTTEQWWAREGDQSLFWDE